MIQVSVADLIYLPIVELQNTSINSNSYVVILWDEVNRRFLPIFVGIPSGEAIAQILTETSLTRPMTFQFMSNMLQAANVNLESVRVESLHEDTYYAIVSLGCDGQIKEVDARPSDAIALALLMKSPIYVNEVVMQEAAIQVPSDVENSPTGRGLSEFMSYRQQKQQEFKEKRQEKEQLQPTSREENLETIKNLAIKFLFPRDRS